MPSAEQLYQEAKQILSEGHTILWVWDTTKYQDAIDTFQDIIDNYPYSDYAVLANLEIADTYFARERYEEAPLLLPRLRGAAPRSHARCPTRCSSAALCYYQQATRRRAATRPRPSRRWRSSRS